MPQLPCAPTPEPEDPNKKAKRSDPERTDDQARAVEPAQSEADSPEVASDEPGEEDAIDLEGTLQLLERHKRGDRSATEELIRRNQDKLLRYVRIKRRLGRDAMNSSADFVQIAFQKFFRSVEESHFEYRGKGSAYAYLKAIVDNLVLGEKRRPQGLSPADGDEVLAFMNAIESGGPGPEHSAMAREILQQADDALLELREDYREVILNRFFLEAPAEVVAEWMGCKSAQDVHALYYLARKAWRVLIERRVGDILKDI